MLRGLDLETDYYRVSLRVEGVERGDGIKAGDVLVVSCFQRTRNFMGKPSAGGHHSIPDLGDRIHAFVRGSGLEGSGNYKDWYDLVEPSPRAWLLRLTDRRKFHLYVIVIGFLVSLIVAWRSIKRRRTKPNDDAASAGV